MTIQSDTPNKLKRHNNILTILLYSLTLISCGLAETKKKFNEVKSNMQVENDYSKVISDSTNNLTDKVENLELEYTVWGCACPQWIQSKDNENSNTSKNYLKLHFYIEPTDKNIEFPIYFEPFRHRLKVTGQFYKREDYPKGTIKMEEPMPKAKVFRYSKFEVIDNPNFKPNSKVETLTLTYNALSCTCAQWSEYKKRENINTKNKYWLEPANKKLIDADKLYNGENLPVIIKVTGQIISENGFPKRDLPKVSRDEAGIVFRYSKIEVIQNGKMKNDR